MFNNVLRMLISFNYFQHQVCFTTKLQKTDANYDKKRLFLLIQQGFFAQSLYPEIHHDAKRKYKNHQPKLNRRIIAFSGVINR